MNTRNKGVIVFSLLLVVSLVLAACQPAATPGPAPVETIIVTQIVEGTPQIIVVTPTPGPEQPTPAAPLPPTVGTGPIPADSMVACNPLPEIAYGNSARNQVASRVSTTSNLALLPGPLAQTGQQTVTQEGDYLVGVFEDVTSLNHWQANGPDNTVWNSYMLPGKLSLFTLSDVYFTFIPEAAAIAEVPELEEDAEGRFVVDIPIRQDITWSDGTPFTANDVAFTANAVVELGIISGNWGSWYDSNFLEGMEVVDDYTVRIIYHTRPGLARHQYGVLTAPILAAHYWEPIVDSALTGVRALGDNPDAAALSAAQSEAQTTLFQHDVRNPAEPNAGPFLLESWEPGASLSLVANPDYFLTGVTYELWEDGSFRSSEGTTVGSPTGEADLSYLIGPHFESIVYFLYGTQDAAILALRQGEVDFTLNSLGLQRGLANQLLADPALNVVENETLGFRYISFNVRRQPMNDCSFRQAMAMIIDKEFVTNTILQGVAFPLYTFVPQGNAAWFYDEAPRIGEGLTREQRVNAAVEILTNAGFSYQGGNVPTWDAANRQVVTGGTLLMPNGQPVPPITLLAPSPGYDPLRSTFAIWIETWAREIGIPLTAELAGFNVIVPRVFSEQNFDIYMLGWSLTIFPDYLYDFFAEEQAVLEGNNAGGYINPEFEAQAQSLLSCTEFDECTQIANRIQDILATELPYIVLFDTGIIEAYRTDTVQFPYSDQLSGLQFTHRGGGLESLILPVGPQ
jgi:peptide/nickel transport system substrate-binding protein